MCVLAAVLAQAGRIGFDVARIVRRVVEGRGEQLNQAVAAADQLRVHRRHRAHRALALAAPEITAHDWAMESILHSSLVTEPRAVPSSK
jgi:hypothetical protein